MNSYGEGSREYDDSDRLKEAYMASQPTPHPYDCSACHIDGLHRGSAPKETRQQYIERLAGLMNRCNACDAAWAVTAFVSSSSCFFSWPSSR